MIAIAIGLFNWDLLSTAVFVGADNFLKMFRDKLFLNGLKVSFLFVGIEVPLILVLEMLLAVLLSKLGRFSQKVYLTMIFLPVITPWLVVVMMWGFSVLSESRPSSGTRTGFWPGPYLSARFERTPRYTRSS